MYNSEGYSRAVETLSEYKVRRLLFDTGPVNEQTNMCVECANFPLQALKGERYPLSVVVEELKSASSTDYKTALVAFVNCLIISAPRLPDRIRVRNEFIGQFLLEFTNMGYFKIVSLDLHHITTLLFGLVFSRSRSSADSKQLEVSYHFHHT